MVENKLLKKIGFLKDLPDAMLEKVGSIANLETFDKDNIPVSYTHLTLPTTPYV